MNIKTIGFSILFMFSVGAHANVTTVTQSITRVQTAVQTTGVSATSAFNGLTGAAAAIAARVASAGTLDRLESISQAIENVAAEDSEVDGMSKDLRVEALMNIFTVVALTDSATVVEFIMGKPYVAASTPNAQGDESLNGDAVQNFNRLLSSVVSSNPSAVAESDMDSAIAAADYIGANSLAEMGPCSNASLANNR